MTQGSGVARGSSPSCRCCLRLTGEAFLGDSCSEVLCVCMRGTSFVVNGVEGAHQPSRDVPCRCLASGFTGTAIPHHNSVSANTKDKQLNKGFSRKLSRGLQNTFNPAFLL